MQGEDQAHQLFGGMRNSNIVVLSFSPFLGKIGGKRWFPFTDKPCYVSIIRASKHPELHNDNNCLGKLAPVQFLPTMITEGLVFTLHRLLAARADRVGKHLWAAGIVTNCRNGHRVSVT